MELYKVEPSGQGWRVSRAGQPILSRPNEASARRAAAVLNEWALVEQALQLNAPLRGRRATGAGLAASAYETSGGVS